MEIIIITAVLVGIIAFLCTRKTKPEDVYNELELKDRAITGRQREDESPIRRF